jgi:hypothetical protein
MGRQGEGKILQMHKTHKRNTFIKPFDFLLIISISGTQSQVFKNLFQHFYKRTNAKFNKQKNHSAVLQSVTYPAYNMMQNQDNMSHSADTQYDIHIRLLLMSEMLRVSTKFVCTAICSSVCSHRYHFHHHLSHTNAVVLYFLIDNMHLMYNAHPKLFRHSF